MFEFMYEYIFLGYLIGFVLFILTVVFCLVISKDYRAHKNINRLRYGRVYKIRSGLYAGMSVRVVDISPDKQVLGEFADGPKIGNSCVIDPTTLLV